MSPRVATAVLSVAAFEFGKHGAGGCSALAPLIPRIAGTVSARTEQIPTGRALSVGCRSMIFLHILWLTVPNPFAETARNAPSVTDNKTTQSDFYSGRNSQHAGRLAL